MHTVNIGDISEAEVIAALLKAGHQVSIPFSVNQRYDLVLDDGNKLSRVQVKTGSLKDGIVKFSVRSVNSRIPSRDYEGEVDFFGVFVSELGKCFLVPIELVPKTFCTLRLQPRVCGRTYKNDLWATDFEIS